MSTGQVRVGRRGAQRRPIFHTGQAPPEVRVHHSRLFAGEHPRVLYQFTSKRSIVFQTGESPPIPGQLKPKRLIKENIKFPYFEKGHLYSQRSRLVIEPFDGAFELTLSVEPAYDFGDVELRNSYDIYLTLTQNLVVLNDPRI